MFVLPLRRRAPRALLLAAGLLYAGAAPASVFEVRISAGPDDAEESGTTAGVDLASSDIELVRDGGASQTVGLRFRGVAIPAGATIQQAWIQFEADEVQTGSASLTLQGDASEESPLLLPSLGDLSTRPRTTAAVPWVPLPWTLVGEQGPNQRTPSLVALVQELVDAPSWTSGDPLTVIVTGSGRRTARAFEEAPAGAALLHVEYEAPSNQRPTLSIGAPARGTTLFAGSALTFTASASDAEAGDVSASITWVSSLDGVLGTGASFVRSDLSAGTHVLTTTANDGQGGVTTRTRSLRVFAPANELVAAGDIGSCPSHGDEATAKLLETLPGTILGLGDYAYLSSSSADFASCFEPSWGRHKTRMRPAVGDEMQQPGGAPYFAYFGAAAGTPGQGWYSFDVGSWHVVALNSDCAEVGCDAASPQAQWLEADLAAKGRPCTLAYFHEPRFSSGIVGVDDDVLPFWQILYAHGVDVSLHGDDHAYERFARMSPSGIAEPLRGMRSFIVGTGGVGLHGADEAEPNSEIRGESTFGVLRLSLGATSYSWQFVGAGPGSFADAGSEECVYGAPAVAIEAPASGAVLTPGGAVTLTGTAADLEQGNLAAALVWTSSRDGALGTGASVSAVLSTGAHVLTASVTDETGLAGSAHVNVQVGAPPGSGCGIGPELAPGLLVLAALRRRLSRGGR